VILVVPQPGEDPAPDWHTGDRPQPEGLRAACLRTANGYVYELALPLSQLGARSPAAKGQALALEIQLDDREIVDGQPTLSCVTSCGNAGSYEKTAGYVRCTVE